MSASEGKGWRVSADQPVLNPEFLMGSLPIERGEERGREAEAKGKERETTSFKPQLRIHSSVVPVDRNDQPTPLPRGFRMETPFLGSNSCSDDARI